MDHAVVDLVYGLVDLFHRIVFRKIILLNPKNPRALYFYKNTHELFQN
jgi:hypothetical protein